MKILEIQKRLEEINKIQITMKENNLNTLEELRDFYFEKYNKIQEENINNVLEIREDILNRFLNKDLLKEDQAKLYYELKTKLEIDYSLSKILRVLQIEIEYGEKVNNWATLKIIGLIDFNSEHIINLWESIGLI